jgi:hypothetical protein
MGRLGGLCGRSLWGKSVMSSEFRLKAIGTAIWLSMIRQVVLKIQHSDPSAIQMPNLLRDPPADRIARARQA